MKISPEFKDCQERGRIKKFTPGPKLAKKELKLAREDLRSCQKSREDGNYKWSIIQAYYSMFHSARALLYSKSYREKSHYCLIEAIKVLFVARRKVTVVFVESLIEAKNLREAADYYGDFSELNAKKLEGKAEECLRAAKKLME